MNGFDPMAVLSRLGVVEAYEGVRLSDQERAPGLHYYQCRHPEDDWSVPETIERGAVWANFWGTVACTKPVAFDEDGRYELTEKEGEAIAFLSLTERGDR